MDNTLKTTLGAVVVLLLIGLGLSTLMSDPLGLDNQSITGWAAFTDEATRWTFEYPEDWQIAREGTEFWFLQNFASGQEDAPGLDQSQVKIDFATASKEDLGGVDSVDQLLDCQPTPYFENMAVIECETVTINGREYKTEIQKASSGANDIYFYTVLSLIEDTFYSASAIIATPAGEDHLLKTVDQVYQTFEIAR